MPGEVAHAFDAVAFVDNVSIREFESLFPGTKGSLHELIVTLDGAGHVFAYPFGALVFLDVPAERREAELARLSRLRPRLIPEVVRESFVAIERPAMRWTFTRAGSSSIG
jgi:hypothetical protein